MKEERRRAEVEVFVLARESHGIRLIKCSRWMNSLAHRKLCKQVPPPYVVIYLFIFLHLLAHFAAAPQVLSSLASLTCDAPAWARTESLKQRGDVTKCNFPPPLHENGGGSPAGARRRAFRRSPFLLEPHPPSDLARRLHFDSSLRHAASPSGLGSRKKET